MKKTKKSPLPENLELFFDIHGKIEKLVDDLHELDLSDLPEHYRYRLCDKIQDVSMYMSQFADDLLD